LKYLQVTERLTQHLDGTRVTAKPEVKSRPNSQLRGREVGLEEIAADFLQARFWIASGWPTIHEEILKQHRRRLPEEAARKHRPKSKRL